MISTQSIPPRLVSEFPPPQITPLSCLLLPKMSTSVDCCLQWVVQHLQAFCILLAAHHHHIVVVPLLSSNCHHPITVLKSPPSLSSTLLPSAAAAKLSPFPSLLPWPLLSPPLRSPLSLSTPFRQRCFIIIVVVMLFGGQLEELD